ncbi:MAG: hypothetical protein ACOYNN_11820 [Terrimicrobiaceae bacterium]
MPALEMWAIKFALPTQGIGVVEAAFQAIDCHRNPGGWIMG